MKLDKSNLGSKLAAMSTQARSPKDRLAEKVAAAERVAETGSFSPPPAEPGPAPAAAREAPKPRAASANEALQEVVDVPLDRIIDNPFDSCPVKDEALVDDLARSMAAQGQRQPILLARGDQIGPTYAGRLILIEGHHRRDALVHLKRSTVKAIFIDFEGERDLFEISQAVNEHRRKQMAAINQALSWRGALKGGLYESERELAEKNGFSHSVVNRTLKLLELPASIVDRLRSKPERVGLRLGYALFQYGGEFGEQEVLRLADKVFAENSRVTAEEVERLVALHKKTSTRKRKQNSRQFKITGGTAGKPIGVLKDWDSGRIVVDITVDDQDQRRRLLTKLKETFEIPG